MQPRSIIDRFQAAALPDGEVIPPAERGVSNPARWWVDRSRALWATITSIGQAEEHSVIHLADGVIG